MESDEKPNVELVKWLSIEEWNNRERDKVREQYSTFEQLASAIDERGPYEIETDRANQYFVRASGKFENGIVVPRQSGLNVRRIYIDPETFDLTYGDVAGCVDHLLSNNAIGPEVELAHVRDFAIAQNLKPDSVDEDRKYERDEIDAVACLQMIQIMEKFVQDYSESEDFIKFIFAVGFTAGRNFSSLQNATTLESYARSAMVTEQKNKENRARGTDATRQKAEQLRKNAFSCLQNYTGRTGRACCSLLATLKQKR
ncbi:MAG: hypothetical protein QNJ09_14300 [Paracoccaceae bacterium]|nr:hypothetical protein [Paracoccaceae bacterium]